MNDFSEIVKSGAGDRAADLFHKLLGPSFEQLGEIFADYVKPYRARNLIRTIQKTEQILREAGLPANAVPARLLIPIVEACSIEDNETLQDMWAALLATASQKGDSVSPSFVETLKQLTPEDARHFEIMCSEAIKRSSREDMLRDGMSLVPWSFGAPRTGGPLDFKVPLSVYADTYERLGLIRRTYEVESSINTNHLQATQHIPNNLKVNSEVDGWYEFTEYAVRFLEACQGQRAKA